MNSECATAKYIGPSSEIDMVLDNLRHAIDITVSKLGELESRLVVVTNQTEIPLACFDRTSASCALSEKISGYVETVNNMYSRLNNQLERLAL